MLPNSKAGWLYFQVGKTNSRVRNWTGIGSRSARIYCHSTGIAAISCQVLHICCVETLKIAMSKFFEKGSRRHFLFCAGLLSVFCLFIFSNRHYKEIAPRGAFLYLLIVGNIYTARWISKRWLLTNQWMSFIVLNILSTAVFSLVGALGFAWFLGYKADGGDDGRFIFLVIPGWLVLSACGASFMTVTRTALRQQLNEAKLASRQRENELDLLRSQLSPHFLFNTLNNLYGLSMTQQEKMPVLLLKLSDLLRYSVYEARQPAVLLKDEIAYIQNYIELEKIRLGERLLLTLHFGEITGPVKIAPLLFIVFVENAFKHAKNTLDEKIRIDLNLLVVGDTIYFSIGNSFDREGADARPPDKNAGLGIGSTRKRLELLYPGAYQLRQQKEKDRYHIQLQLKAW